MLSEMSQEDTEVEDSRLSAASEDDKEESYGVAMAQEEERMALEAKRKKE